MGHTWLFSVCLVASSLLSVTLSDNPSPGTCWLPRLEFVVASLLPRTLEKVSLQSKDIQETRSGLDNEGVMFSASSDSELLALSSAMTAFNVDGDFS